MGKHHWLRIEYLHRVGSPESKRLKVAALNLFNPTAPPLLREAVFSYFDTASLEKESIRTRSAGRKMGK